MVSGEAMADDENLCFNFEDNDNISNSTSKRIKPTFYTETDVTPNSIRLEALKLSKELKGKNLPLRNNFMEEVGFEE